MNPNVLLLVMPTQARIELSPHGVVAFAGVLALIVRVWSVAGDVVLARPLPPAPVRWRER